MKTTVGVCHSPRAALSNQLPSPSSQGPRMHRMHSFPLPPPPSLPSATTTTTGVLLSISPRCPSKARSPYNGSGPPVPVGATPPTPPPPPPPPLMRSASVGLVTLQQPSGSPAATTVAYPSPRGVANRASFHGSPRGNNHPPAPTSSSAPRFSGGSKNPMGFHATPPPPVAPPTSAPSHLPPKSPTAPLVIQASFPAPKSARPLNELPTSVANYLQTLDPTLTTTPTVATGSPRHRPTSPLIPQAAVPHHGILKSTSPPISPTASPANASSPSWMAPSRAVPPNARPHSPPPPQPKSNPTAAALASNPSLPFKAKLNPSSAGSNPFTTAVRRSASAPLRNAHFIDEGNDADDDGDMEEEEAPPLLSSTSTATASSSIPNTTSRTVDLPDFPTLLPDSGIGSGAEEGLKAPTSSLSVNVLASEPSVAPLSASGGPPTPSVGEPPASASQQQDCHICMERAINCAMVLCGHLVSCYECGHRLTECPMCRQPVRFCLRLFVC